MQPGAILTRYGAAAFGGAAGGVVLATTGNTNLANATSGFMTSFAQQGMAKISGAEPEKTWDEIFVGAALDGVMSYGIGSHLKLGTPKTVVSKWDCTYRGVLTKMRKGIAHKMSLRVFRKGIASQSLKGVLTAVYYGWK